jgi:hypothetical protein
VDLFLGGGGCGSARLDWWGWWQASWCLHVGGSGHNPASSEAPPRTAERVVELGISLIDLILPRLTQGLAVMINRPPPPATPKSDHRSDRPCHPKVAGQTHCLRKIGAGNTTVEVHKTLDKCQSLRDQGSLAHRRAGHG